MAQLNTANTFSDGDTIHGADLNNLVDQAFALDGLITEQAPITTTVDAANDLVLVWDASAPGPNRLRKALAQAIPAGVTSVAATATPATVFGISVTNPTTTAAIALSLDSQAAGLVLAGPVSGAATTPSFRALSPSDLPVATVTVAATLIDWSLGNCFFKLLSANTSFTFSNPTEGQVIQVHVQQDASHTVTWPTGTSGVFWPGGTVPVMTLGAGHHDILMFRYFGGHYYGTFYQNFLSV